MWGSFWNNRGLVLRSFSNLRQGLDVQVSQKLEKRDSQNSQIVLWAIQLCFETLGKIANWKLFFLQIEKIFSYFVGVFLTKIGCSDLAEFSFLFCRFFISFLFLLIFLGSTGEQQSPILFLVLWIQHNPWSSSLNKNWERSISL